MSMQPLFPTIGIPELLIILVIVLIFFGAGKLPQIGKALGEGIRGFREGTRNDEGEGTADRIEMDELDDPDQRVRSKKRSDNSSDTR